jgi:hypothetical protein
VILEILKKSDEKIENMGNQTQKQEKDTTEDDIFN